MLATPKPEATPSSHRHLCTASTAPPLFHCVLYRVFDLIPESMSNTSSAALQLDPEWPYWKSCEYKGIRVEGCSDTIRFAASPWGVCDITDPPANRTHVRHSRPDARRRKVRRDAEEARLSTLRSNGLVWACSMDRGCEVVGESPRLPSQIIGEGPTSHNDACFAAQGCSLRPNISSDKRNNRGAGAR